MTGLDWWVVAAYFVVLVGIVWWSARRQRSSEDYFLAGRNVGWFVIGASLFASNIGSEHLVGLASTGAQSGMAMAHYELHAWCLLVLGWVFVPFYSRSGIYTMPEFLEKRFDATSRWVLSLLSLVAYVFTKVSVSLYAGGIVFRALLPEGVFWGLDNFWVGAVTVMVLTGIYTVLGGLRAVVYTDAMQAVVLIVGSVFVTIFGLMELGGWGELRRLCSDTQHFNMWRPWNDPDFPWAGILIGAPIVGLWYWCTDQYIVQRTLAARGMKQARRGTIFGAYLKLSPVFLFIIPGMIAFALMQMEPSRLDLYDTTLKRINWNLAYPRLVLKVLPWGLRGLVVGALLAALMSSLSSLFNSCSTLFTMDIYEKIRPGASDKTLVRVGRVATGAIVLLGMAWIPVMQYVSGALYVYLQKVQAYLGPPITAVFFLGVFAKRVNAKGAVAGLLCGFGLGLAKLAADILVGMEWLKPRLPGFIIAFGQFNFLYFCIILFAISIFIVVGVSLLSAAPSKEKLAGLTYATVTADGKEEIRKTWNKWDVINTLIVLALIAAVYVYFTG